jgi:hypothetical protein
MNRQEFIQELLNLYPNAPAFNNPYSKQKWVEGYSKVLKGKIDFDRLYEIMITEYMSMNTPPAPAWFSEYVSLVRIKEKKQNIEVLENRCPPPKEFLELKAKLSGKVIENNNKMKG